MSKYDKEFEKLIMEEETLLEEVYMDRLISLDNELKVRLGLGDRGFMKVEPTYTYENTPEFIEHQKEQLSIAVKEEKAKIRAALNNIERNRLQRKEQKELRKEAERKSQ